MASVAGHLDTLVESHIIPSDELAPNFTLSHPFVVDLNPDTFQSMCSLLQNLTEIYFAPPGAPSCFKVPSSPLCPCFSTTPVFSFVCLSPIMPLSLSLALCMCVCEILPWLLLKVLFLVPPVFFAAGCKNSTFQSAICSPVLEDQFCVLGPMAVRCEEGMCTHGRRRCGDYLHCHMFFDLFSRLSRFLSLSLFDGKARRTYSFLSPSMTFFP